jgi:hypothetical protein
VSLGQDSAPLVRHGGAAQVERADGGRACRVSGDRKPWNPVAIPTVRAVSPGCYIWPKKGSAKSTPPRNYLAKHRGGCMQAGGKGHLNFLYSEERAG